MGKRDSKAAKAKRQERRGKAALRTEAKTAKSEAKKDKKDLNRRDEEDLDALLAEFRELNATRTSVKEVVCPPPSPRANCTLTAHPSKDELLLFGGERYDGRKNLFYAELFRYSTKRNEWKQVISPNCPPPRSSHQAVAVAAGGGSLFLFGGEFSSHNQAQFHHYRDFWCLDLATVTWEQVTAKNGPSARSGHRMAHVRDQLVVFGGFFDNLRDVKYYNDCHIFDLSLYKWTRVTPEPGASVPSPRSGFQMAVDPAGGADGGGAVILYGGYFKKKVAMQQFDQRVERSQVEELSDTGVEYRDLWSLDVGTGTWDTMKKSGAPPSSRSGYAMLMHKRRLVVFGGVHDEDTADGDGLDSTFYNDLHAYSLDSGRWHELSVAAPKRGGGGGGKAKGGAKADDDAPGGEAEGLLLEGGGRRRNRNKGRSGDDSDDDEAVLSKLATPPAEAAGGAAAGGAAAADSGGGGEKGSSAASSAPAPCPRMKPCCAVRGNLMYVYGGLVEPEEASELTLNDMWCLDLSKMDGWRCLYEGENPEACLVREDDSEGLESDSDEDDGESGSDDESESDDESSSDGDSQEEGSRMPVPAKSAAVAID